jgi:hypothetical protein
MVRVLGDVTGLTKAFKDSGSKATEAAKTAQQSFGTMLNMLNQTGALGPFGEALGTVNEAIGNIIEHGHKMGDVMLGAGGAVAGVGVLMSTLGSKEQAAHQQLAAAIDATGHSYDEYGKAIDEAIKHNEKYGQSSAATQDALQVLTQATHDPAEALKLLGETTDLAAAKHETLNQAATDMGRVYNGNTKLLKEFGITVDKNTHLTKDHQTATQALANVVKGQAAASTDTFTGHLKALGVTLEDQVAVLGEKYGPALQGVGGALAGLGAVMKTSKAVMEAFSSGQKAAADAAKVTAAAEDAEGASGWVALGPILLIIAAVVALVAIAYILYRNWNTVWTFVKGLVMDVWGWIKTNWPLLLGILLGPIGLAAALIWKYWAQIKAGAADVWNWIVGVWNRLYGVLISPFVAAGSAIGGIWNNVVSFFAGFPGRVAATFASVTGAISGPFKAAFNAIANAWNSTVGALNFSIPSWVPGLGGKSFGMPKIPTFATGGIMPYTGLALLHKDETVIPAGGRTGPAVVIQNAHFATELDVEAFMRRAAWVAQTARI